MKRIGLLIALFAGLVFVFPSLTAQDAKKDGEKAEKKDEAKKDDVKKDEKKDPEKKDDEKKKPDAPPVKEKKLTEKMPAHGAVLRTKILSANGATNREFTIEMQEIDPKKVADLNNWKIQQSQALARQQYDASTQKDFKARVTALQNYQKSLANYNIELAKRSGNIYSSKPLEVRAHDDAKVRTMFLPVMFDDQGFQKKWTEKEKREFRGDTQLPGYPSDFEALKSGQFVEIYLHKKAPPPKDAPKKKKGGPDDDLPVVGAMSPEFIVIVILQEGK